MTSVRAARHDQMFYSKLAWPWAERQRGRYLCSAGICGPLVTLAVATRCDGIIH